MIEQIDLMSYVLPTFKFPKDYKIKLFEAFSGIGCQRLALKRLTDNYESVGISEIDKPALKSYEAIHGDCKNYGSICDIHELPEIDIFTWSFPCTDLSKAGKQKGLGSKEKGQEQTRSGLCYEVLRVLHENTNNLPRVLIMENVIDLIQVKFIRSFNDIQREIESLGYKNYTFVMNGKNYGIPQNRERVFMVSILSDYQEYYYEQPKPFPLKLRLKDLLEDSVDEKYYLSKKMIDYCTTDNEKYKKAEAFEKCLKSVNEDGIAVTVNTREGCTAINNYVVEGGGDYP